MWKSEEAVYIFVIAFCYSVAGLLNIIIKSTVLIEIKLYPKFLHIV